MISQSDGGADQTIGVLVPERLTYTTSIKNLELPMYIGATLRERARRQRILVTIAFRSELPGKNCDDVSEVVSYSDIAKRILQDAPDHPVALLETLAGRILSILFREPRILHAQVELEKPGAIANASRASVTMSCSRDDWFFPRKTDAEP